MLSSVWLFLQPPLPWLLRQHLAKAVFLRLPSPSCFSASSAPASLDLDHKCVSCSRCHSTPHSSWMPCPGQPQSCPGTVYMPVTPPPLCPVLTSSVASRPAGLPSCPSSAPPWGIAKVPPVQHARLSSAGHTSQVLLRCPPLSGTSINSCTQARSRNHL